MGANIRGQAPESHRARFLNGHYDRSVEDNTIVRFRKFLNRLKWSNTTMYFKQIPVGNMANFSYLFGCEETREAAVADPTFDADKILGQALSDGYRIRYIFTTHGHADHIGGHRAVMDRTGAKVVAHRLEAEKIREHHIPVDILVADGTEIKVGTLSVQILHTPGHTPGGISLLLGGRRLVTGDSLFVGDCGRTDLPGGSLKDLYESIRQKLMTLPESIEVYPGHDYGKTPSSTIGEEKRSNPAMRCKSLKEFEALP